MDFQKDLETKLDQVYKGGAQSKYGYDDIGQTAHKTHLIIDNTDERDEMTADDKMISKMVDDAK